MASCCPAADLGAVCVSGAWPLVLLPPFTLAGFPPARQVLHRRANLCRPRVVHELHATRLPGQPPGYFTLDLRTQAGTYIKEFVHGEWR